MGKIRSLFSKLVARASVIEHPVLAVPSCPPATHVPAAGDAAEERERRPGRPCTAFWAAAGRTPTLLVAPNITDSIKDSHKARAIQEDHRSSMTRYVVEVTPVISHTLLHGNRDWIALCKDPPARTNVLPLDDRRSLTSIRDNGAR